MEMGGGNVAKISHKWRSLLSSMSSCGFCQIPTGKSEFRGIPWNFYGKHLAGASAIWVSISMEIPTFFQGIPMEMVGIWEPPGMIPNGIHGIPLEFHWNSMVNSFEVIVKNSAIIKIKHLRPQHITCGNKTAFLRLHYATVRSPGTNFTNTCCRVAMPKVNVGVC